MTGPGSPNKILWHKWGSEPVSQILAWYVGIGPTDFHRVCLWADLLKTAHKIEQQKYSTTEFDQLLKFHLIFPSLWGSHIYTVHIFAIWNCLDIPGGPFQIPASSEPKKKKGGGGWYVCWGWKSRFKSLLLNICRIKPYNIIAFIKQKDLRLWHM